MIGRWVAGELTNYKSGGADTAAAVKKLYADLKADPGRFFRYGFDRSDEAIKYLETYYREDVK